jgi:hypothetical protein
MEYTKKALEAQEAVDEATKLALQRVRMEAEVLKQVRSHSSYPRSAPYPFYPSCY